MSDTDERTSAGFSFDIEHLDGSATIRLAGVLDAAHAGDLREELWPLLARYEAEMVTIVADDLGRLDDEGLRVLTAFARAMAPGRPLVRGVRSDVRAALAQSGNFRFD